MAFKAAVCECVSERLWKTLGPAEGGKCYLSGTLRCDLILGLQGLIFLIFTQYSHGVVLYIHYSMLSFTGCYNNFSSPYQLQTGNFLAHYPRK